MDDLHWILCLNTSWLDRRSSGGAAAVVLLTCCSRYVSYEDMVLVLLTLYLSALKVKSSTHEAKEALRYYNTNPQSGSFIMYPVIAHGLTVKIRDNRPEHKMLERERDICLGKKKRTSKQETKCRYTFGLCFYFFMDAQVLPRYSGFAQNLITPLHRTKTLIWEKKKTKNPQKKNVTTIQSIIAYYILNLVVLKSCMLLPLHIIYNAIWLINAASCSHHCKINKNVQDTQKFHWGVLHLHAI